MANLNELRDLRGKAVADARKLKDTADAAKRVMNEDEQRQWDAYLNDAIRLKTEIENEERQLEMERDLATSAIKKEEEKRTGKEVDATTIAFRKMILEGERSLSNVELNSL